MCTYECLCSLFEVIVTYPIPDEGGDPKWKKEVIDPRIDNLVRRMREGHKFKATDFRGGDSSLPPLKAAEKAEGVDVKKNVKSRLGGLGKPVMNLEVRLRRLSVLFDLVVGYVNRLNQETYQIRSKS